MSMPKLVPLSTQDVTVPLEARSPNAPVNWLLIGPMARECGLWGEASGHLVQHLRSVQPEANLYELDLPGTGQLHRERSPSAVLGLVEHLRTRVQEAGLQGPFGLIASSWAASIGTEWTRQYGEEVGALVLISPGMRPFTQVFRAVRWHLWPTVLALVLGRRSPLGRERRLWNTHTQLHRASGPQMQAWRTSRKRYPVRARNGLAHALAVWRYETSRRRPHRQVLLLAGKGDDWLDWRVSAAISRAWGAALRVHPEAGHDLLLDDPQWVARSLADWLMPVGSGGLISNY
jgi:pimeloyl-ACP methyl ester carboxylesterase